MFPSGKKRRRFAQPKTCQRLSGRPPFRGQNRFSRGPGCGIFLGRRSQESRRPCRRVPVEEHAPSLSRRPAAFAALPGQARCQPHGRLAGQLPRLSVSSGPLPLLGQHGGRSRPLSGQGHRQTFAGGAGHRPGPDRVPARGASEGTGSGRRDQLGDGGRHCRPHYGGRDGLSCRVPRRRPDLHHVGRHASGLGSRRASVRRRPGGRRWLRLAHDSQFQDRPGGGRDDPVSRCAHHAADPCLDHRRRLQFRTSVSTHPGRGIVEEGALSSRSIRNVIQKRARQAGIDSVRISGHSLRIGSAQSLALRGASLVELQQAGRWTSPHMPGRYVRGQLASRGPMARIRYGKGS